MKAATSGASQTEQLAALRICDANFNRLCEGLRVVEEYFRFYTQDALLAKRCKELRHDATQVLAALPPGELARARQTELDAGTGISTPGEQQRHSLSDVVSANFKRVEQALRAIEEYGKLLPRLDVREIKQLRYRAYSIGKAILIEQESRRRLGKARLYALIDGGGPVEQFDEGAYRQRVASLILAGVDLIQLREKTLDDITLLDRARIVRELADGQRTLFVMNDRADLAVASGADGVHLGQQDLPVHEARRIVGAQSLIGVSTHSLEQARRAVLDGADYIGCGPTFPSTTKQFDRFPGLELLRQIAAEITLPAFAIGGITLENVGQVMETGLPRVAVSGAIWNTREPQAVVRSFIAQLPEAGRHYP